MSEAVGTVPTMMTDTSTGKLLRLRGAIQATLDALPPQQAAGEGEAMAGAYRRLRAEVCRVVHEEDEDEFKSLFPTTVDRATTIVGSILMHPTARYSTGRGLLASLAGWLDGYIEQARMAMEAQAYAEARVRQERAVGFQRSSST